MEKELIKAFMERYLEIEKSLITTYRKELWAKFNEEIETYRLIENDDKICVYISGDKNSMLLAKLFEELHKHSSYQFDVTYLVLNLGYTKESLDEIKKNLQIMHIDAEIVEINKVIDSTKVTSKFLCAKIIEDSLYELANERGCSKIALGHHYDDVIETTFMNLLNVGSFQTLLPKVKSMDYIGMELIRPLYLIREHDIKSWCTHNNLHFIKCTSIENGIMSDDKDLEIKRSMTKQLIQKLKKEYNPLIEAHIFSAGSNVNLDSVLGYIKGENVFSYLDDYEE